MTHLNIQQGSNVEIVSAQIIKKLYDTALTVSEPLEGETDAAYMSGHISVPYTYESYVNYLAGTIREGTNGIVSTQRSNPSGRFLNLTIDVTNGYYIPFEDPKMITYLNSIGVGSNGVVNTNEAAAATVVANSVNTEITKFNELKYFTSITESKGGWTTGNSSGSVRFYGWTALEEVDISNFISIGHKGSYGWEDVFSDCTSLKKVTASDKLKKIGYNAFNNCSNLEDIINENGNPALSGIITLSGRAFRNCAKLKNSNFTNCSFLLDFTNSNSNNYFSGCTSLTSIALATTDDPENPGLQIGLNTRIPNDSFNNCTNLTTVTGLDKVTYYDKNAFLNCKNLVTTIDLTNVIEIGLNAFRNTKILVTGTPSANINISAGAFYLCSNLTSFDFSNITTLNDSVFYESGLSGTLSIPNLTGVLNGAEFYKCTGLTSITNLGSITSITDSPYTSGGIVMGSFLNCTGLTSVTIPSTVTKIGYNAFSGCTSLSQVNCSWQNVIEVGLNAFNNHADWNFIVNLSNLTTLGKEAFGGYRSSKKIRQLYIPKIVNTDSNSHYQNYVYYSGTFTGMDVDIIYLRDLQSLHPGDFTYTTCTALVINNITPPVWKNKDDLTDEETTNPLHTKDKVFGGSTITNIYVPDSAVTTYQNDANWSSVANKIQPLSNLTKVATEADLLANQVALIEAYM